MRYVYDDQSVLQTTDLAGETLSKYDYGPDRLLSLTKPTEGRRFYLFDGLRSVTGLTDPAGSITFRASYDAWGTERRRSGSSFNLFGFTSHERDDETGLYYARARCYDPRFGLFLTEDPELGDPQNPPSLHRYLYAFANPTVYVDPTGREGEAEEGRGPLDWLADLVVNRELGEPAQFGEHFQTAEEKRAQWEAWGIEVAPGPSRPGGLPPDQERTSKPPPQEDEPTENAEAEPSLGSKIWNFFFGAATEETEKLVQEGTELDRRLSGGIHRQRPVDEEQLLEQMAANGQAPTYGNSNGGTEHLRAVTEQAGRTAEQAGRAGLAIADSADNVTAAGIVVGVAGRGIRKAVREGAEAGAGSVAGALASRQALAAEALDPLAQAFPRAKVGFRGSLARGARGPHKGGRPFDPANFDVDAFIVSDELAGLVPQNSQGFRNLGRLPEYQRLVGGLSQSVKRIPGVRQGDTFKVRVFSEAEFAATVGADEIFLLP